MSGMSTAAGSRGGRARTVDVVVLAAALAVALTPLLPAFGAGAWAVPVLGGLVLGVGIGALGAVRRWPAWGVVAALLVAYFAVGGALAAPSTTTARVLPGRDTVVALAQGAVLSWKQVLTLQPPLGSGGSLQVAPLLLALVGAVVATSVALRGHRPAAAAGAAVVPVVVLPAAVLLGTRETVAPVAAGVGLALGLVGWATWRAGTVQRRRLVALGLLTAVSLGGGVLGGPLVLGDTDRYVLRDEIVPPFDPRDFPSPLSAFREYVKTLDDTELFTVAGLPAGARVRLATLDRFDGVVWNVAGDGSAEASGEFRRVGSTIADVGASDPAAAADRAQVTIEVTGLTGVWLPTVGEATAVRFDDGEDLARLRFNDATGAAVLTGGVSAGLRYTLDTVVPPVPDDEAIGAAPAGSVVLPEATGVPDVVAVRAADVARDAGTPVQVARSIAQALSEDGFFSHGRTEAGDYPSLSGHGADRITTLLGSDLMVGDSEQYASAMALMARQMGLPARVVLGFVPGSGDDPVGDGTDGDGTEAGTGGGGGAGADAGTDGGDGAGSADGTGGTDGTGVGGAVSVTGDDIEAWVEINFVGYGWVPFDPTPPRSQTPQEDSETTPSDPEPQVVQPPPAPPEPVTAPDDDDEQPRTQDPGESRSSWATWQIVAAATAAGLGVLGLLALPFLVVVALKVRRRRRRKRALRAVDRVSGGWDEVVDVAQDLRRPLPPVATRRETARALTPLLAAEGGRASARTARTAQTAQTAPSNNGPGSAAGRRSVGAARSVGGSGASTTAVELAGRADAAVFGPGDPPPEDVERYWRDVEAAVARMWRAVPRRTRLRGRVSLRSLRGRRAAGRREAQGRTAGRQRDRRLDVPRRPETSVPDRAAPSSARSSRPPSPPPSPPTPLPTPPAPPAPPGSRPPAPPPAPPAPLASDADAPTRAGRRHRHQGDPT
ncbi:transglutaminase family protein [Cellulomonas hominis]